jgi:phosphopantetheine binding protein
MTVELPDPFQQLILQRSRFIGPAGQLGPDVALSALGIGSLEIVELIVDIEDTFGIEVPLELLTPELFATPGTIWGALSGLIAESDQRTAVGS